MNEDKLAVITGGGTGIGAATAEELAASGMKIVITGRRPAPLQQTVGRIQHKGGQAYAYPVDVSDWEAMRGFADEVLAKHGQVDLLIPNAAVHDVSKIAEGDPVWWKKLIEINVLGLFNTVRAFLPSMLARGKGHVVVMSSVSGRVYYVDEAIYECSKHAQVCFVECLRQEVTQKGIRVTIIEPGMVETPMIDNPFAQELKKSVTPLEARDCARLVRYIFEQPENCVINEVMLRPVKQLV